MDVNGRETADRPECNQMTLDETRFTMLYYPHMYQHRSTETFMAG